MPRNILEIKELLKSFENKEITQEEYLLRMQELIEKQEEKEELSKEIRDALQWKSKQLSKQNKEEYLSSDEAIENATPMVDALPEDQKWSSELKQINYKNIIKRKERIITQQNNPDLPKLDNLNKRIHIKMTILPLHSHSDTIGCSIMKLNNFMDKLQEKYLEVESGKYKGTLDPILQKTFILNRRLELLRWNYETFQSKKDIYVDHMIKENKNILDETAINFDKGKQDNNDFYYEGSREQTGDYYIQMLNCDKDENNTFTE